MSSIRALVPSPFTVASVAANGLISCAVAGAYAKVKADDRSRMHLGFGRPIAPPQWLQETEFTACPTLTVYRRVMCNAANENGE